MRLEVFGSALREDFGPASDVDFMVTFDQQARWSLFDLVDAEQEMSAIVGRPVDLVERVPIEKSSNWIRREAILDSAHTIYVALRFSTRGHQCRRVCYHERRLRELWVRR